MEEKVNGLLILLEQEAEFYENLLDISLKEQKSIVSGKVDEIEKITREKEKIILEINKLEKARLLIWKDLSEKFSLAPSDLTLTKLQEKLGEKYSKKLNILQKRIETVVHKLKNIAESNAELIKTSLDYIQFSLNLLSSSPTPSTYSVNRKTEEDAGSTKILDKKA